MMLKFSAINSLIGLGAGFIIPLVPTWFYLRFNIGDTYTGPLLAISGVTIGLSAFGSARVAKRYGQIPAIAMMTGASTLFMFSLAFIPNPIVAASLYLVRAALMNMASPLLDSFLMSITSSDRRGLASSINTVIWRLPNSGSTIIGGMILAAHFYNVPFIIAGAFYATSIILMYSVFRNVKPMQDNKVTTHPR
jgi:predicted MFS family arabinose efflux permease